ncbi:MAG: ATP-binding protein [Alphaproteobacteria bacterium]
MTDAHPLAPLLARIAAALESERPPAGEPDLAAADAFLWQAERGELKPVATVRALPLDILRGIDHVRDTLAENTRRFADGLPANNALLWGARGMGKSSLVKAVHGAINAARPGALALIEIHREDLASLPALLDRLRTSERRFLLFCDDLSFDAGETSYKSLKAVLEGGLEGKPDNVLFYATSNRRHLMPRQMIDNEREQAIHPGEAVEEKVSLSDRFGLWLGFYACDQATYLDMVHRYARHFALPIDAAELDRAALEWAQTRGGRSGRVAWQFIQDLGGRLGRDLRAADR